jgi:phosphomannomutase
MLDRLAKSYGVKIYETPVGFNHIADIMMNEDVLIGGEESGGISFKGHIPEGDGPIMGLLLVEMLAASGKSLGRWSMNCLRMWVLLFTNAWTCA